MNRSNFELRSLLIEIDCELTNKNRKDLCDLFGSDDVPRRYVDAIAKDNTASMIDIWEVLLDRRKIHVDDVNYLSERLEKIGRMDLANLLRSYSPLPLSSTTTTVQFIQSPTDSNAIPLNPFRRIDP